MDDMDTKIALALDKDGRRPNSEIARQLGVSEGTVRQRLKRLTKAGVLKIQAMVNADEVPNQYMAVIGLNLRGRRLETCAKQIRKFPEVQRTLIVTGRYDILVSLLLDSRESLVDFVTHKLSKVPGVQNSETFLALKNYDPWFPAGCLSRQTAGRADAPQKPSKPSRKGKR